MTNTPETLNILTPDFRMPEHCGGDRWSILHGDSLQILRQFEPNSFDAIITDPPYASGGSSQTTKNRSTNEKYSSMSKEKALPDFDSDQMDQLSWMFWTAAWLQDARRIAKPGAPVCLFIDWRQLPAMTLALQWAGWTWRGVAVWDKVASRPQKGRFRQQSEYIVWGSNGKMPLERNVGCLPGVFRYPNPQNRMVAHRYGLDTAAFNFDRVVALYGNLGKEQQRGFLTDVNIVGGGLLRSLSRTLAVQSREPPTAEYAVAVPSAKKQSRQRERG